MLAAMRIVSVALSCLALACSEATLDLHLIRRASSPVKREAIEPTPCEHCVARTWVAHDGRSIDLEVEGEPYLSISARRLSQPEIVHEKHLYRPYCESFVLSFRLAISLEDMAKASSTAATGLTLASIDGRSIDTGRHIFRGETVTLAFSDRQEADATAERLGGPATFIEGDDSWRAGMRKETLAALEELVANPEMFRELQGRKPYIQLEDLKNLDPTDLFCP